MTVHTAHPIPISAKRVDPPSTSSSHQARPTTLPSGSAPRSYPTSSPPAGDGPTLSVRPSTSSPSPSASSPPPSIPAALPQSYTTQLSDLLLSAVVPGIPKTKGGKAGQSKLVDADGRRLLTSKKEELNLTSTTQNFRKFVLKIGWLFALQDQVEQLIFWHRPSHSVVFLISWSILSFKPHLLLLIPPIIVLSALLSPYNLPPLVSLPQHRATPVWEDEVGPDGEDDDLSRRERSASSPTRQGSVGHTRSFSVSGGHSKVASEHIRRPSLAQTHAIEERKTEANLSSVYYQNIQGIQNLMGAFSDGHDVIAGPLTTYFSPTHPLHQTFIALSLVSLCLLAFFANSIPPWVVLLPVGWGPLLVGLIPPTQSIPLPPPALTPHLHTLHLAILNDRIPPHLLSAPRMEVAVWESQRFGGASAAAGAKDGWEESTWGGREVGSGLAGAGAGEVVHGPREVEIGPKGVWGWMPGEEWFVDRVGEWAGGVDAEGWSYLNSHHQTIQGAVQETDMEIGSVRRRRWWRRGVRIDGQDAEVD